MSAASSIFWAYESVHSEERAISLSLKNCHTNPGPLVILFQVRTQSDPCISSIPTAIMITTSNSPVKGSGIHTQLLGVLPHTIAISGLSRVRTELRHLLVVPSLAPHPVQTNGESAGHRDLGDLPPPPHRQVKILAPPFRVAAHRDLRRFHQ